MSKMMSHIHVNGTLPATPENIEMIRKARSMRSLAVQISHKMPGQAVEYFSGTKTPLMREVCVEGEFSF